jgi:hypothetical protein
MLDIFIKDYTTPILPPKFLSNSQKFIEPDCQCKLRSVHPIGVILGVEE